MSDNQASETHGAANAGWPFPRAARLTRPADFKRVFDKPVVSADHCFKVLARPGTGERSRLGMAVSRQVDKRAAGRNRIKRVIRESFRRRHGRQGAPTDFVVLPRSESATICNTQLFDSLEAHWARIERRLDAASRRA